MQIARICMTFFLSEEICNDHEEDHQDGHAEKAYLQPLIKLAAERNGLKALTLETRCIVIVVMTMMVMLMLLLAHDLTLRCYT